MNKLLNNFVFNVFKIVGNKNISMHKVDCPKYNLTIAALCFPNSNSSGLVY